MRCVDALTYGSRHSRRTPRSTVVTTYCRDFDQFVSPGEFETSRFKISSTTGWVAGVEAVRLGALHQHAVRRENTPRRDGDAGQDCHAGADPAAVFDPHRLADNVDQSALMGRANGMRRGQDPNKLADPDIVADPQCIVAIIEKSDIDEDARSDRDLSST